MAQSHPALQRGRLLEMPEKMIMIALAPYELETLVACIECKIFAQKEAIRKMEKDGCAEAVKTYKELVRKNQALLKRLKERRI